MDNTFDDRPINTTKMAKAWPPSDYEAIHAATAITVELELQAFFLRSGVR